MPRPPKAKTADKDSSTANLGFEANLWLAADKLRNKMDAAEPVQSGSDPQITIRATGARRTICKIVVQCPN